MGNEGKNGKVSLISKIAYGFGDVGCNFSWMFVSNFLMIFYTDVFGISMAAVSALMLFSRFWDAINDPIVGGLTDKTKTRWGMYYRKAYQSTDCKYQSAQSLRQAADHPAQIYMYHHNSEFLCHQY